MTSSLLAMSLMNELFWGTNHSRSDFKFVRHEKSDKQNMKNGLMVLPQLALPHKNLTTDLMLLGTQLYSSDSSAFLPWILSLQEMHSP